VVLPAPFHALGEHLAIDLPAARAVFTTRRGGDSHGPYASLNLGLSTDDDPESVLGNRQRLESELGVRLASSRQVHGTRIHHGDDPDALERDKPQADGVLSTRPGVAPMVTVADCVPIALAGTGGVAMLHAGWRGLAGGIVAAGVRALRAAGVEGELGAAIGPGAGGCCYEVGEDVHAAFGVHREHATSGRNLDLKAIARAELQAAGVREIHDVGICTICADPSLFYSHRRDRGITGRQAGVAWLRR